MDRTHGFCSNRHADISCKYSHSRCCFSDKHDGCRVEMYVAVLSKEERDKFWFDGGCRNTALLIPEGALSLRRKHVRRFLTICGCMSVSCFQRSGLLLIFGVAVSTFTIKKNAWCSRLLFATFIHSLKLCRGELVLARMKRQSGR